MISICCLVLLITSIAYDAKEIGEVKFFNDQKGYGFIGREGKPDLFVHFSAISGGGDQGGEFRKLSQGDKVEFDVETIDNKERAKNVKVIH